MYSGSSIVILPSPFVSNPAPIPSIKASIINAKGYAPSRSISSVLTKEQLNIVKSLGYNNIYVHEKLGVTDYPIFLNRINDGTTSYKNYVCHDIGLLKKGVITSEYFNVTNSKSVLSLIKRGAKKVTLSIECSNDQIRDIANNINVQLEVIVYGKVDAMISKYCPITKSMNVNKLDCGLCEHSDYALKNQEGSFELKRDFECNMRVLNHKPINKIKDINVLKKYNISSFRVMFTSETEDEIVSVLKKIDNMI